MLSKDLEKCMSTGKIREDRQVQSKYAFDALQIRPANPVTAILLLQCEEKSVLLAAAEALAKYATKTQENLEFLFDLGIVNSVIPIIEHEDLFTRRFAGKLLAEMTAIPSVLEYLMGSEHYLQHFTKLLINERDIFMQEFASLILARFSNDPYGAAQLLKHCPNLDFLFERMQSRDADVKKNNLQIMYNLIRHPQALKDILEAKSFQFSTFYKLFDNIYPEIQRLAINMVYKLLARSKDEHIQTLFRESNGLETVLHILDTEEWSDLHVDAFKLLNLACDNSKTAMLLNDIGGIRRIFKYLEDSSKSCLFMAAFEVVVQLAATADGREMLHLCNFVDYLIHALEETLQPELYEISCRGIGNMAHYFPAAEELTEANVTPYILELIKNETVKWSVRNSAMFAVQELMKTDPTNCKSVIEVHGQLYLTSLLKQPLEMVPIQSRILAVGCLVAIMGYPHIRPNLTTTDMADALCTYFAWPPNSADELRIACCNALSMLCLDQAGRECFLKILGPQKLLKLLTDDESIPVRTAATQLIQQLCSDPSMRNAFVECKYLIYMLKNRSSARIVPTWDTCIETLFNSHLPIKFALTGRLSVHDVTLDGFYVMRKTICPFPVLEDILRYGRKNFPYEAVYVVNCGQGMSVDGTGTDRSTQDERYSPRLASLLPDPYLNEYIQLFKCKLLAAERRQRTSELPGTLNLSVIEPRAKMLAEFVVRQMSGPDPDSWCVDHQLEVHLKELEDSMNSRVIPLGVLRVGSYLERSLLFKVIADRICLPAALVRGEYGRAWIEIAIPQWDTDSEILFTKDPMSTADSIGKSKGTKMETFSLSTQNGNSIPPKPIYPTSLLKPNLIVDLMINPGDLIPIGTDRAKAYCDKQLVHDITDCEISL